MTPERYRQIGNLLERALELEPERRAGFLEEACGADQELRREVESLIAADERAGSFIAAPAFEIAAGMMDQTKTETPVARRIGHYEILSLLGEGGMGQVYLAEDTKLDRKVAIKFLSSESTIDSQGNRRLIREAKAAAKLDHPNICAVHEVGQEDSGAFIVMQYLQGETLASRTARKPLDPKEALEVSLQVADALSEAHAHGIIHRDIKPQNIMLTARGHAKVMDFGLAKIATQKSLVHSEAETETLLTERGMIIGTVPYMSPEQVNGQPVDERSDIFSFGAVLYEMVTGELAFHGASAMATLAAVLNKEPKPLPSKVPKGMSKVILRCLRKDPADRFQTVAEVRAALENLRGDSHSWRRYNWVAVAAILLIAGFVGLFALKSWRGGENNEQLRALPLTTLRGVTRYPSLSPDGNYVAFTWTGTRNDNPDIYLQQIGSGEPLRLTTDPSNDYNPIWSPDGRSIAFLRSQAKTGKNELRLVPTLGGQDRRLAEIRIGGGINVTPPHFAWSADSNYLVATDSPGEGKPDALFVISLETGDKRQLTYPQIPAAGDSNPTVSSDGRWLVFRRSPNAFYNGELFRLQLGSDVTAVGEPQRLTPAVLDAEYPTFVPGTEEILFSAKGSLWRLVVPGDSRPSRLPYVGEYGLMPTVSRPQPGRPTRLVYVRSFADDNILRLDAPAPGAPASLPALAISSTRLEGMPQLSPDGSRVAFCSDRSGDWEIWLADLDGANSVQLTSMGARAAGYPHWSPDGEWIVFHSNFDGQWEIYMVPVAGGKPRNLTSHPATDTFPSVSSDGRWIYFNSTRTGEVRIWKMPASGGDVVQVTNSVGFASLESPEGAYLYYVETLDGPSALWRVPVSGGAPVKVLEGVVLANFVILKGGIYYIDRPLGVTGTHYFDRPSGETRLQYFDFATRRSMTVARDLGDVDLPLTASPDGRTILFPRADSSLNDLMMVENFR